MSADEGRLGDGPCDRNRARLSRNSYPTWFQNQSINKRDKKLTFPLNEERTNCELTRRKKCQRSPGVLEAFRGGQQPTRVEKQRHAAVASVNEDGGQPRPQIVVTSGTRVHDQMQVHTAAERRCTANVQSQTGFVLLVRRGHWRVLLIRRLPFVPLYRFQFRIPHENGLRRLTVSLKELTNNLTIVSLFCIGKFIFGRVHLRDTKILAHILADEHYRRLISVNFRTMAGRFPFPVGVSCQNSMHV